MKNDVSNEIKNYRSRDGSGGGGDSDPREVDPARQEPVRPLVLDRRDLQRLPRSRAGPRVAAESLRGTLQLTGLVQCGAALRLAEGRPRFFCADAGDEVPVRAVL